MFVAKSLRRTNEKKAEAIQPNKNECKFNDDEMKRALLLLSELSFETDIPLRLFPTKSKHDFSIPLTSNELTLSSKSSEFDQVHTTKQRQTPFSWIVTGKFLDELEPQKSRCSYEEEKKEDTEAVATNDDSWWTYSDDEEDEEGQVDKRRQRIRSRQNSRNHTKTSRIEDKVPYREIHQSQDTLSPNTPLKEFQDTSNFYPLGSASGVGTWTIHVLEDRNSKGNIGFEIKKKNRKMNSLKVYGDEILQICHVLINSAADKDELFFQVWTTVKNDESLMKTCSLPNTRCRPSQSSTGCKTEEEPLYYTSRKNAGCPKEENCTARPKINNHSYAMKVVDLKSHKVLAYLSNVLASNSACDQYHSSRDPKRHRRRHSGGKPRSSTRRHSSANKSRSTSPPTARRRSTPTASPFSLSPPPALVHNAMAHQDVPIPFHEFGLESPWQSQPTVLFGVCR